MSYAISLAGPQEGDDARIDAARLRLAREERGLSVPEAARLLTLSRAQVEQIEQGGVSAFYSPAHKTLAVRKYASAFGLDADEVLGLAQNAAGAGCVSAATDPGLDAVPAAMPPAEAPARVIASALPVHEQADPAPEDPASAVAVSRARNGAADVRAPAWSLILGLLLLSVAVIAFAVVRGWIDRFAEPSMAMAAAPVAEALPPADPPAAEPVNPTMASSSAPAHALPDCAAGSAGAAVPQWMPPYVRKPGSRLYISGPPGSEVCVVDSAGKVSRLVLKAGAMQSVDGRPPYFVQSASLEALQMFLQGLKVRVPVHSASIRLLPGEGTAVRDAGTLDMPPSS